MHPRLVGSNRTTVRGAQNVIAIGFLRVVVECLVALAEHTRGWTAVEDDVNENEMWCFYASV